MNADLERVIALQTAEGEIDRLTEEIAALPRRVAAIESKLAETRARIAKAKTAMSAIQAERRKLEGEIQVQQQKISKYRDQQFEVKTNEQYRALLQEIEFAEREIRSCEDRILEGMIKVESQEQDLKSAEIELKAETAEIEKEKAETRARTAEDEKQLAEWNARRDSLRADISPDTLRYYDRVAQLRKTGVAEARDQKCMACNVLLRPQTYNEIRTNEKIIACDSCDRILYYDPAHEPEEAPLKKKASTRGGPVELGWLYLPESEHGPVFLALVNHKGNCSKRVFDATTGRALGKEVRHDPSFRTAFAEEIERGTAVHVEHQPNLEQNCVEQLPGDLLQELQLQVQPQEKAAAEAPTRS
ncbi:MAG TPA: C4-type zinc ribbon domain-containing protein [Terriglobales bacterium]|jgi:hypothetical protein|nr:C4-type zinc ribbon domain-containing protein [Terriglobales bacterium]